MDFLGGKLKKSPEEIQKHFDLKLVNSLLPKKIPSWHQFKQLGKFLTATEKKIISALLIIIVVAGVSFLGEIALQYRTVVPAAGGEYVEGLIGYPSAINPLFASLNPIDADLSQLIYAGLFKYDQKLNLVPDLAEKFTLDQTEKIYSITLRSDLKWQDGEPIIADDIAFTLDLIQDPETKSPLWVSFQNVKFNKTDDLSFTLELEQPFAPFINLLTTGILPVHLWQEVSPANLQLSPLNFKPIGAGPFMFNSLSKDSRGNLKSYSLKPNPFYHFRQPYLNQITFKFFPDVNSAVEALRNRQILGLGLLPKEQKEKINKMSLNLFSLRLPQFTALFLNQKTNLLLKSQALRQALALSIDRQQIIKQALKGEGVPAGGPIPPAMLGSTQDFKMEQNLGQANQILDQDKWKKINREEFIEKRKQELLNTWLEQRKALQPPTTSKQKLSPEEQEKLKKEQEEFVKKTQQEIEEGLNPTQMVFREKNNYGLTITLTILDQPEFVQTANLLREWWQEIGVQVNLNSVSSNQIRQIIKDRSYEIILYGAVVGSDPDPFPLWHSSQIINPGLNLAGYANRQADELLEKARATSDRNQRSKLYYDFQKLLATDIPAIFLYHSTYLYPVDDSIKGIQLTRLYQPADRFNSITEWYMKTRSGWR